MSLNQLQLLMHTKLFLGSQHLPLVRRMPVSATWHIMAALLDGHIMQLEGTLLAELFLFNDLLNTARNCIICLCSFKLAYYVSYMLKQNLICVFS